MNTTDPIKLSIKKPANPYWLILWYMGFLFCVAAFCIHASQPIITQLYAYAQNLGLETFLLSINRPHRMHEFLLERGNEDRWQRITVYFSVVLASLLTFNLFALYLSKRYLRYLSETVVAWSDRNFEKVSKACKLAFYFGLFLTSTQVYLFVFGTLNIESRLKLVAAVHLDDFSFYQTCVDAAIFTFGCLIIHASGVRWWHARIIISRSH